MTDEDRSDFFEILLATATFYDKEIPPAVAEMWFSALKDIELARLRTAFTSAISTSQFMPKPVQIQELAGCDTPATRAHLAWERVLHAIAHYGSYRSVWFEDTTINAAIRSLGGWPTFLGQDPEEFDKWGRLNFIKSYGALRHRSGDESAAPLWGLGRTNRPIGEIACEYLPAHDRRQLTHGPSPLMAGYEPVALFKEANP